MIDNLPLYVTLLFILTTFLTLWFFIKADHYSKRTFVVLLIWLSVQGLVGISGFYTQTDTLPPRFLLLIGPALLVIIALFIFSKGKTYLDQLDVKWLNWLHVVRVPVELTLFCLFIYKQIPEAMTFEGRNLDIISGITAPFIAWWGYHQFKLNKKILLLWNFICLGLLFNIVTTAVLAAPFSFQQIAFDQPNVGVLYFPFVWLPGFIVPAVLLSHLVSIRKLLMM